MEEESHQRIASLRSEVTLGGGCGGGGGVVRVEEAESGFERLATCLTSTMYLIMAEWNVFFLQGVFGACQETSAAWEHTLTSSTARLRGLGFHRNRVFLSFCVAMR